MTIPFSKYLSQKTRLAWLLVFALSPLAYLVSIALITTINPNARPVLEIDRNRAIRCATDYVAALGSDIAGWTVGCRAEVENDRYFYYRLHRGSGDVAAARRLAPGTIVRVLFLSPNGKEKLEVRLAPDGRPLGFTRTLLTDREIADTGEAAAKSLADTAFRASLQRENRADAIAPELSEERNFGAVTRRYSYRWTLSDLPGFELQTRISVLGETVVAEETTGKVDRDYARKNFAADKLPTIIGVSIHWLFIAIAFLYGLYRYVQRARQKEIPHARTLLLSGVAAAGFAYFAFQTNFQVFELGFDQSIWMAVLIAYSIIGVMFLLFGIVFGVPYGSGEADVREAYPGKLTSLDALVRGRIFSRNVARAVCIGWALGGWLLLARCLLLLPWQYRAGGGEGLSTSLFSLFLGELSFLLPLITAPSGAMMTAVAGLLLPLSFLHRRFRSTRRSLGILAVLSFVANLSVLQETSIPFIAGLLTAVVMAGALVFAFHRFDFLTAVVTLSAPTLVTCAVYLAMQPAPALRQSGLTSAAIALALLGGALYFLYIGREYRADEVRPLYARHLAERVGMQAEVSAAREAQTRLMPQALPKIEGLALAAACLPARVVGGDFYDIFTLDRERLGVFIAEGGGRGLEAALTIAFAKGFLMPRLASQHSPGEVICRLQTQLLPLLDEGQELTVAYAVIDTAKQTLAYARTGRYPRVLVTRRGSEEDDTSDGGGISLGLLHPEERVVENSLEYDSRSDCVIREATLALLPGDACVLLTDGIAKSLSDGQRDSIERWAAGVTSPQAPRLNNNNSTEPLQAALDKALVARAKRIRKIGLEDDLTAVIVRLDSSS